MQPASLLLHAQSHPPHASTGSCLLCYIYCACVHIMIALILLQISQKAHCTKTRGCTGYAARASIASAAQKSMPPWAFSFSYASKYW